MATMRGLLVAVFTFSIAACGSGTSHTGSDGVNASSVGGETVTGAFASIPAGGNQPIVLDSCVPSQSTQSMTLTWPPLNGATGTIKMTYTVSCADGIGSNLSSTITVNATDSTGLEVTMGTDPVCNENGGAVKWTIILINSSDMPLSGAEYELEC